MKRLPRRSFDPSSPLSFVHLLSLNFGRRVGLTFLFLLSFVQKQLKNDTENLPREQKIAVLKDCLTVIGARIETVVAAKKEKGEDSEK